MYPSLYNTGLFNKMRFVELCVSQSHDIYMGRIFLQGGGEAGGGVRLPVMPLLQST